MAERHDVTRLLEQVGNGDEGAVAHLLVRVYHELRSIAAAMMRGERPNHYQASRRQERRSPPTSRRPKSRRRTAKRDR
jgi:hypothetical protein